MSPEHEFRGSSHEGGAPESEPEPELAAPAEAPAGEPQIAEPQDTEAPAPDPELRESTEAPHSADSIDSADDADASATTVLSPAVRRLVRQYDLDITGIHGTGPSGRIRVGDVIPLLAGRAEPTYARSEARTPLPVADEPLEPSADERGETPYRTATAPQPDEEPTRAAHAAFPSSIVFECDLSRVLAHRKEQRARNVDVLLTSYYVVACDEGRRLVPDVGAARGPRLGVVLSLLDGGSKTVVIDASDESALGSIDDRLIAIDRALRGPGTPRDLALASLSIYHHGVGGSLLATPTPIADGHVASVGAGRARKQIVIRTVDGEDVPRIAALAYISLSFHADHLALDRANRFVAHVVRVLEHWPD